MKSYTPQRRTETARYYVLIFFACVIVGGLAGIVYGFWTLAMGLEHTKLAIWAIAATLALLPTFLAGFWFGKTEVRGFLAGVDAGLDRLAQAVNMRDTSRITMHAATRTPRQQPTPTAYNVILPGALPQGHIPQITHRQLTDDDVLDL